MINTNLKKELLAREVKAPREFNSAFAVVTHIRDFETNEEEVLDWMAYELQNKNRAKVIDRLHQRRSRLRLYRERKELGLDE